MSTPSAALPAVLKGGAIFAILTGSAGALFGIDLIVKEYASFTSSTKKALLDSQYRYFASTWAGFGVLLYWCSNDIVARRTPLWLLSVVMFFGGIARGISAVQHGFSSNWIKLATGVELVGPAALYLMGV